MSPSSFSGGPPAAGDTVSGEEILHFLCLQHRVCLVIKAIDDWSRDALRGNQAVPCDHFVSRIDYFAARNTFFRPTIMRVVFLPTATINPLGNS
jgi:hypothetical protein